MDVPIKSLFFDLDGTVLDTVPGIVQSLSYACERLLNVRIDDARLTAGIGTPLFEQMATHYRTVHGADGAPDQIQELCDLYISHNRGHHDETVRCFDGMQTALDALTHAGLELGIVTSKPHQVARRGLRITGLEEYFQFVIGFDDVVHPKPHPEPVNMALRLSGRGRDEAVFIGDSPHDLIAGRAAGVRTAAALWGPFTRAQLEPFSPDYLLNEVSGMLRVFATRNEP